MMKQKKRNKLLWLQFSKKVADGSERKFAVSRNVSAMNFALSGSPGMRTVLAKSPSAAEMCGVAIIICL